jgi:DUF438 domain-containing protein
MNLETVLSLILDNWNKPVVFVDTNHIIRYMNAPARKRYSKWGDVVGKSIFDCHNENSVRIIEQSFERLKQGDKEVLFVNNERSRVYLRAVRDADGVLVGYHERYEPALGK